MTIRQFQKFILSWYGKHHRDWLPWRQTRDPYRILVSEIMLQQTQVSRALEKYPEFLSAFPTVYDLAKAPLKRVLEIWQGMGYNRRALYLKQSVQEIIKTYKGKIPSDPRDLITLPGIGSYTAGAIACFAFNKSVAFLDTNIRKVLFYHFFHDDEKENGKIADRELLPLAQKLVYRKDPRRWHYALMDYGALELAGEKKLLQKAKAYHKQSPFPGSTRYFRSLIVRYLLEKRLSEIQLRNCLTQDSLFSSTISVSQLLSSLKKEEIITQDYDGYYAIR